MKFRIAISLFAAAILVACGSQSPMGEKVKEPFTGSKYESNNRYFRATGKGSSIKDNIARGKADIEAKNQLAGQVSTNMRNVTDQYLGQTDNAVGADVADKFQSLTRQVMNTGLADLRKIGEEKYYNGEQYTVYIAYEIKKNAMFRFMKKQAKTDSKIDKESLEVMEKILDLQIEATEDDDE
ncbi:hypothetical protein O3Q51_08380 [Cryomorphaceae bacterium 1068]|nr:hypothetical protein [Cryomorphaceae bacterium 1068]